MAEITNADPVSPTSTPWLTVMARLYDPFFWLGEMAGMRRRRRELLRDARGCVVEIGAGTGLNLGHYPEDVDELILCEPEPSMRRRLDRRLRGHVGRVVDADTAVWRGMPGIVHPLVMGRAAPPNR